MKWIVLEENPTLDQYIAVMVTDDSKVLRRENKPCSIFKTSEEAMHRARQLREEFKVSSIKIFYPNANTNDS
jgi:hypothetical protein